VPSKASIDVLVIDQAETENDVKVGGLHTRQVGVIAGVPAACQILPIVRHSGCCWHPCGFADSIGGQEARTGMARAGTGRSWVTKASICAPIRRPAVHSGHGSGGSPPDWQSGQNACLVGQPGYFVLLREVPPDR
jgi:hypothetical protein